MSNNNNNRKNLFNENDNHIKIMGRAKLLSIEDILKELIAKTEELEKLKKDKII